MAGTSTSAHPRHFDVLAPVYDWVVSPPAPDSLRTHLRLPAAGRLLEVGGGTGRVAAHLRSLVEGVVLSDLSTAMLREARTKCDCRLLQCLAEHLPLADASFERVLVVDALHHFRDQRAAVGELLRVLRPGGRLVIEEMDVTRGGVKLIALAEKLALMDSRFYPPAELGALVSAWGLTPQVVTDGQATVWVIVDK